jgi:hypothetical protein
MRRARGGGWFSPCFSFLGKKEHTCQKLGKDVGHEREEEEEEEGIWSSLKIFQF